MKVMFAMPLHDGRIDIETGMGLLALFQLLKEKGIEADLPVVLKGCGNVSVARNTLASIFMESNCTDLFFIDSDIGFNPKDVLKLLNREEDVVAGVYPLKQLFPSFPVLIKTEDGIPIGRYDGDKEDYLIRADFIPTGFMRIKRCVFDKMKEAYPEIEYKGDDTQDSETAKRGGYGFFSLGIEDKGEDVAFCRRWTAIGGKLWLSPNINFKHIGRYEFIGNFHEYLPKAQEESK